MANFEFFALILRLQKGSNPNLGTQIGPSATSKSVYPSHVIGVGGSYQRLFTWKIWKFKNDIFKSMLLVNDEGNELESWNYNSVRLKYWTVDCQNFSPLARFLRHLRARNFWKCNFWIFIFSTWKSDFDVWSHQMSKARKSLFWRARKLKF